MRSETGGKRQRGRYVGQVMGKKTEMSVALGREIRERREALKLSCGFLAEIAGFRENYLDHIEKGNYPPPGYLYVLLSTLERERNIAKTATDALRAMFAVRREEMPGMAPGKILQLCIDAIQHEFSGIAFVRTKQMFLDLQNVPLPGEKPGRKPKTEASSE